ncbi:MAG: D-arabinono-1,4-lactone oxidase [Bacteroidota bacterium]
MKNWSQYHQWQPAQIEYPDTEEAVQHVVQQAANNGQHIRIMGSAHSFMPLWTTEEVLISLDRYQGICQVDQEKQQVTVKAGTKLYELGDLLFQHGLAMENLGDIDRQSIGGTIGTGTHGTGLSFGSISTQVVKLRFVNGKGEIRQCSPTENPSLFKATQVSLGALGIITEITLQCIPAYRLALQNLQEPLDLVLSELPERYRNNRNFEFYWFPYTDKAWTKSSNIVEDQADKVSWLNYVVEYGLENYAFQVLCELAYRFPALNERMARFSAAAITPVRKVLHSHKVYATQRLVRFNEMEYSIPLEAQAEVMREIQRLFERKRFRIHFPIENRVVKGDDIYLSPAHGRDSAYIACHAYAKKDPLPYFKALEEVFLAHDGRPHWGKMNTLNQEQAARRYPAFEQFLQHRFEEDPEGIFLNTYLKKTLG